MKRFWIKMKCRFKKPLDNKRGSSVLSPIIAAVAILIGFAFCSWVFAYFIHLNTQSRAQTITANLVDAIAESGQLNDSIQRDFKAKFDKLRFYTGDYTITYYTYTYKNGYFECQQKGVSNNGANVSSFEVSKGENVQVVFSTVEPVLLDRAESLFKPQVTNVGLKCESAGKVY